MAKQIIRFATGLTQLVIEKKKTMTRRFVTERRQYEVGERVAVAQSYGAIWRSLSAIPSEQMDYMRRLRRELGVEHPSELISWENKLYVRPTLMQYEIEILSKKREYLQDISDEDILREGVFRGCMQCVNSETGETGDYTWLDIRRKKMKDGRHHVNICYNIHSDIRECFADMIDHVCGRDTWKNNPEVWAYEYRLIDLYPEFTK